MLLISKVETFYGNIQALRGVDVKVNGGEIVALIGSNGCLLYTSPSPRD